MKGEMVLFSHPSSLILLLSLQRRLDLLRQRRFVDFADFGLDDLAVAVD